VFKNVVGGKAIVKVKWSFIIIKEKVSVIDNK
jgi:hypothetical protein